MASHKNANEMDPVRDEKERIREGGNRNRAHTVRE